MNGYDDKATGLENDFHPANQIEVFYEIEMTSDALIIQDLSAEIFRLRKEHESIKGILKQIEEMEAKEGIYANCLGMTEKQEKDYIHLRNCLKLKITRL